MYMFVDTNEYQTGISLPAEALRFNGEYIENMVEGYRTLRVSGRELLDSEINEVIVGKADGSRYKGMRYPSRIITVTYQLTAASDAAFRTAYNKLNGILSAEEAELVFLDEPDKYFIGTKRGSTKVSGGSNNVIGEIEFYCTDPFKYAMQENSVTPALDDQNTFFVNYTGTHPSQPRIVVDFLSDCGYVAFADQNGNVLQFGDPDEINGKQEMRSERLINDSMQNGVQGWMANSAIVLATNEVVQQGSFGATTRHDTACVEPTDYGTKQSGKWYGPSCTMQIPESSIATDGPINPQYWDCTFRFFVVISSNTDMGMAQFSITDENEKNIASVTFAKIDRTNHNGFIKLYVEGAEVYSYTQYLGSDNDKTSWDKGRCRIHREVNNDSNIIIFQIGDYYFGPYVTKNTSAKAKYVSFFAGKWEDYLIGNIGIRNVTFVRNNVPYWNDIPNKFGVGDRLELDCDTGDIHLNGIRELRLGAVGNDWGNFSLIPGSNQIRCFYSNWATQKPKFNLKYREVYI